MTVEIRDARPDDAESIVAVLNPIIAAGVFTALDTPFTADAEREFIRAFPARGVFLVAVRTSDRLVVGTSTLGGSGIVMALGREPSGAI